MQKSISFLIGAGVLASLAFAVTTTAQTPATQANKAIVLKFYNALNSGDIATMRANARADYIQHDPAFETGLDGLIKRMSERPKDAPPFPPLDIVRSAAEGDLVWLLRRWPSPGPGKERAEIDIFRVQDGKVAEHWDYMETFPRGTEPPRNNNGHF